MSPPIGNLSSALSLSRFCSSSFNDSNVYNSIVYSLIVFRERFVLFFFAHCLPHRKEINMIVNSISIAKFNLEQKNKLSLCFFEFLEGLIISDWEQSHHDRESILT